MRNHLVAILGSALCFAAVPAQARPIDLSHAFRLRSTPVSTPSDTLRDDLRQAKAKVYPALVNISVVSRYFQDGRALRAPAGGSGAIVTKDGYVITNYHVAGDTTHIVCTLTTGESIEADDVADDPLSDLSVLKLRLKERTRHTPIPYATLGDSDTLKVGDFVLAMGNPLMLSSSMTLGIASNTKRVFTNFTGTEMTDMSLEHGERTGMFTRWIQHDALILPGNSGGPLVDLNGEIVGFNELGGNGEGFAIPSNIARHVLQQVLEHGRVIRGTLGVTIMPVQKLARSTGALISAVTPGFPADKAGIKPGDIILSIDGTPTNVEYFEEVPVFYQMIAETPVGKFVTIRVLRNGKPLRVEAKVMELPPFDSEEEEFRTPGVTVRDLTPAAALADYLPNTNGVEVTGVRAGFPFESAEPPIEPADIITSINGRTVDDVAQFSKALGSVKNTDYPVSLLRHDEHIVCVVKPSDDKQHEDGGDLPQAWLGVKTQVMVPDLATALGMPSQTGYRVTEVLPWTEASKAGLKPGDVITALNGNKLDASQPQDADGLTQAIENLDVGSTAKIMVMRGGASKDVSVILEKTPTSADQSKSAKQKELEFAVREITLTDKAENHWSKDQTGLLVTDVTLGSWSNIGGLRQDDLIESIDGINVGTIEEFNQAMKSVIKAHPKVIEIFVRRDYLTQFVFLEPDWTRLVASD